MVNKQFLIFSVIFLVLISFSYAYVPIVTNSQGTYRGAYRCDISGDLLACPMYNDNRVSFFNISDKSKPASVYDYYALTHLKNPFEAKFYSGLLYISSYSGGSITVLNYSNISLITEKVYFASTNLSYISGFRIYNGLLYSANTITDSITILNISNVSSIYQVGYYNHSAELDGAVDIDVYNGVAYIVTSSLSSNCSILALNVSIPSTITRISCVYNRSLMNYSNRVSYFNNSLYVISQHGNTFPATFIKFNITNPFNIVTTSSFSSSNIAGSRDFSIEENMAYIVGSKTTTMVLVNISSMTTSSSAVGTIPLNSYGILSSNKYQYITTYDTDGLTTLYSGYADVPLVSISPLVAYKNDSLSGICKAESMATPYDNVTLSYRWYLNNMLFYSNNSYIERNTDFSVYTIPSANLSKGQNWTLSCMVNVSDEFEGDKSSSWFNTTGFISNSPPIISNFSLSSTAFLNSTYFIVNVSDVDNDVLWVNFTVLHPNGSLQVWNSTLSSGLYISQSFILLNGSYFVNVTSDDGSILSSNFTVSNSQIITPSIFTQTISSGQNYSFIMNIDSNTSTLDLNYSISCLVPSNMTCNVLSNVLVNASLNVSVVINTSSLSDGSYTGNLTLRRVLDNYSVIVNLSLSISNIFGRPLILNLSNPYIVAMYNSGSSILSFNLSNNGTYNLSDCRGLLDGSFNQIQSPYVLSNGFVLVPNASTIVNLTFSSSSIGSYSGFLSITCNATSLGGSNSLDYSLRPNIFLTVSQYIAPSGGGGGGSTVVIVPSNVTSFKLEYELGGSFANPIISRDESTVLGYYVTSLISNSQTLQISCEGQFCKFVTIPQSSITVFGGVRDGFSVTFDTPSSASYGDSFSFDIVVKSSTESHVVKNTLVVSRASEYLTKLTTFNVDGVSSPAYLFTLGSFLFPKSLFYIFTFFGILGLLSFRKNSNSYTNGALSFIVVFVLTFLI